MNDDEKRNGGQAGRVMVASYRYLGVSNPGLQITSSNESDVSYISVRHPMAGTHSSL